MDVCARECAHVRIILLETGAYPENLRMFCLVLLKCLVLVSTRLCVRAHERVCVCVALVCMQRRVRDNNNNNNNNKYTLSIPAGN